MALGANIKAAIEAQGRRENEVAAAAGLSSPQVLNKLTRTDAKKSQFTADIAAALMVSAEDLMQDAEHAAAAASAAWRRRFEEERAAYTVQKEQDMGRDPDTLLAIVRRLDSGRYERLIENALDLLQEQKSQPAAPADKKGAR